MLAKMVLGRRQNTFTTHPQKLCDLFSAPTIIRSTMVDPVMTPQRPTLPMPAPPLKPLLQLVVDITHKRMLPRPIPYSLETSKTQCLHLCKRGSLIAASNRPFHLPFKPLSIGRRCKGSAYPRYRMRFKVGLAGHSLTPAIPRCSTLILRA